VAAVAVQGTVRQAGATSGSRIFTGPARSSNSCKSWSLLAGDPATDVIAVADALVATAAGR